MRIGILGGTGPAGSALGARLASVGYEVVIGSRSKYRAMETVDGLKAQFKELNLPVSAGDNIDASSCDVVVLATPWDSAATTAQEHIEQQVQFDPALFAQTPDYLLKVRGMSMRDAGILDGDLLAVRKTQNVRNGQIVVARVDGGVTVKRL